MKKRLAFILFGLALLLCLFPALASAEAETSGKCGDDLAWSYDQDIHVLVFTGSGDMYAYGNNGKGTPPWAAWELEAVGVSLPKGLTSISDSAFPGFAKIKSMNIPSSVTSIGQYAFDGWRSLTDVYYGGTEAQKAAIQVGENNDPLLNATWHCAPTPTATPKPTATPTPKPTATAAPLQTVTVKAQAKKVVKLQVPKVKGNSYQWYVRSSRNAAWESIGKKGTKNILKVKVTMARDGYQFICMVRNAKGTFYSDIYQLYVYEPLKIKKQPKWTKKVLPGEKMSLSVKAQGADGYQWYTRPNANGDWAKIEGATHATYGVNVQQSTAYRQYVCQVRGREGNALTKIVTAKVAKIPAPKITKQPAWKKATKPGQKVTLTIVAKNVETYQWYYRTSSKGNWIPMNGATKRQLIFTARAGTNGYQYKCVVKGKGGTAESKLVTLKVLGGLTRTKKPRERGFQTVNKGARPFAADVYGY